MSASRKVVDGVVDSDDVKAAGDAARPDPAALAIAVLQTTPELQAMVRAVLDGTLRGEARQAIGPLLVGVSAGARELGVSRSTLQRMIRAGRLQKVELYSGAFRLRRTDIEAIANGGHN